MEFLVSSRTTRGKAFVSITGMFLLLVVLASCGGSAPPPRPPHAQSTQTPSSQFTSLNLGLPPAALNAPVVGPLPGDTPMHVAITYKTNQQLLAQLDQRKVPYAQSQDLASVANTLGISGATYQQIKAYFGASGATLKLGKLHTNLTIDARAQTFARLFQTSFILHKLNGRTFYEPSTAPELPSFVASSIVAVTGLDNYSVPLHGSMTMQPRTVGTARRGASDCHPLAGTLVPTQVAHAYGYDQFWHQGLHGEGMTVNLVELDGFYQSDIQNYLSCVHFQGKLKVVNVNSPPTDVQLESTLDIETVAGLAPAINIVDYQGPNSFVEFNDELQQIINDNTRNTASGSVVSISWGGAEDQITGSDLAALDSSLQLLTKAEHMTVFADTYDCAAFADQVYNHLSVSFPASDPQATAVGGTVLHVDAAGNRANETAWSNGANHSMCSNTWGSGGGLSTMFKRQSWQNAPGVQNRYTNGARQLPDVSAIAFNQALYYQGQWLYAFGTSEATPTWATGMALVNQILARQVHQFYYGPQLFYMVAHASDALRLHPYYDVTRGNNLYYPATPGWDYATGLGTPNLKDFSLVLLWAVLHLQ